MEGSRVGELEHQVAELRDEVARLTAEVRELSLTDELTGASSRRGFLVRAEQARLLVRRRKEQSVLLVVGVDGLNGVDDGLGHDHGDDLRREAAMVLSNAFRECDVVGRWDGDDFVTFLGGAINADPARRRLEERVDRSNLHRTGRALRISIGAATVTAADTRPLTEILSEAFAALHAEQLARGVPSTR
ncbi:MAG: GGDEF domain-containing protein [Acidimicrobiia bacterium]